MIKLIKWVLAPIAVIWFLGWAYIQINYPTCTFRYKLTAEVNTPEGVKTGSSVIEVSYSHNGDWGGGETPNLHMTGEAPYIDLGSGKNLFLMLTNRASGRNLSESFHRPEGALDAFKLPLKALDLHWEIGDQRSLIVQVQEARAKGLVNVPFENLPTLISFKDLTNPDSVQVVQPDGVSKIYGSLYALKNVTLEVTYEYPQSKIETTLPWLEQKRLEWENKFGFGVGDPILTQLFYDSFKQPYYRG